MAELRKRKLKDDLAPNTKTSAKTLRQPRSLKKVICTTLLLGFVSTVLTGLWMGDSVLVDKLAQQLGYEGEQYYAVIIDAGSSGSRVLAYRFRIPYAVFGKSHLVLEEEYFEQSKPGLSSFADEPEKGAESIVRLIKNAEFLIPKSRRKDTPLLVRATAGLRLLPQTKSDLLVSHVKSAISLMGYGVSDDSVRVMEGSDEGIFIWYTLNMLFGNLKGSGEGETMVALDLGGGSTQITYQLADNELSSVPAYDIYGVPGAEKKMTVFTHSYLNLGLLAARYGVLKMSSESKDPNTLISKCVDPIVQNEPWTYANAQYNVSGAKRLNGMKDIDIFSECHSVVKKYVLATMDWEPLDPPKGQVAAMSYFFDVAADAGLLDVAKGGQVKVKDYRSSAIYACSNRNIDQPFACIDLVYITTLLHDGYKMKLDENVSLYKKINGHEVSWALGLAYTTLLDRLAYQ